MNGTAVAFGYFRPANLAPPGQAYKREPAFQAVVQLFVFALKGRFPHPGPDWPIPASSPRLAASHIFDPIGQLPPLRPARPVPSAQANGLGTRGERNRLRPARPLPSAQANGLGTRGERNRSGTLPLPASLTGRSSPVQVKQSVQRRRNEPRGGQTDNKSLRYANGALRCPLMTRMTGGTVQVATVSDSRDRALRADVQSSADPRTNGPLNKTGPAAPGLDTGGREHGSRAPP
jgi:hypothetical protein